MRGTEVSSLFVQHIDLLSFSPFEGYKVRRSYGVKLIQESLFLMNCLKCQGRNIEECVRAVWFASDQT